MVRALSCADCPPMSLLVKQFSTILPFFPVTTVELRNIQIWHLSQLCSQVVIVILAWNVERAESTGASCTLQGVCSLHIVSYHLGMCWALLATVSCAEILSMIASFLNADYLPNGKEL